MVSGPDGLIDRQSEAVHAYSTLEQDMNVWHARGYMAGSRQVIAPCLYEGMPC